MIPATGRACASVLSHQHQYAGIAVYLRTTGLRDTAGLVDAIALLNVRTAFWHLRSLTIGSRVESADAIPAPRCIFGDPHAAVQRLRHLLQADLESTEHLLAQPVCNSHNRHDALTLHLQDLRRARRLVADLADGTDPGTERAELEGRARHLKTLLDASCGQTCASRDNSGAAVTRPRQPIFVRRPTRNLGRPRIAG